MYDFYMHGMLNYEDDINILIANKEYSNQWTDKATFSYDYTDPRLTQLRKKYALEDIAGVGDDFIKLLRITFWLSKHLKFGAPHSTESFHALDVIEKSIDGYESNCYIAATVLVECFLSMGFVARMVRCMPIDLRFNECHCVAIAFIQDYKKFVAFDASMGGCYINEFGIPMSLAEIRNAIIEGSKINLRSIYHSDYVNNFKFYLSKNLVRFQSLKNTTYGNAIAENRNIMINLNPVCFPLKDKICSQNEKIIQHIFISNDDLFWETNLSKFNKIVSN